MLKTKDFIGDRKFYLSVLAISIPIMIQNGITNLVNLLDNVMVGRLGTEAMSGVSIVNQFVFIFNLLIFGAISAAGIFTAQYYGKGDNEGIRQTLRFKLILNFAIGIIGTVVFFIFADNFINLFLHGSETSGSLSLTLELGKKYLYIMLIGLIPYAVMQAYASTMRETGETVMPMIAGLIAVLTNLALNSLLIFGLIGFPALGVAGAAIATVISRFVEMAILIVYCHKNKYRFPYIEGLYKNFRIAPKLSKNITVKGIPLMLNEFFWAIAITMRNQCYSTRGLNAVAAQNISSTIFNLFSVVYMSVGTGIAIILGALLGAGKLDEAKSTDKKLIGFSVVCGFGVGIMVIISSTFFPYLYNTTAEVQELAAYMMIVSAATMPFCAFANSAYYTLRSGGKVIITILFDSCYMWAIVMPTCIIMAYFTNISIHWFFAIGQALEIFKLLFGILLLKRGTWLKNLVEEENINKENEGAYV